MTIAPDGAPGSDVSEDDLYAASPDGLWPFISIELDDDVTSEKVCYLNDLNLFVSSSDTFRTSVGGYLRIIEDDIGFVPLIYNNPINPYIYAVLSHPHTEINIEDLLVSTEFSTIIPNNYFVCVVHGDSYTIEDDAMWKTLWTGGEIDDTTYTPILNEAVYEDHSFRINTPYAKIDSQILDNPETVTSYMEISYDYNYFLSAYQNYADGALSELLLPNWYVMKHTAIHATGSGDVVAGIYNKLSIDEKIEEVWSYFPPGAPPLGAYNASGENVSMASEYLSTFATSSLSTKTQEYALSRYKNILFGSNFYNDYIDYNAEITGSIPYYTKISFTKASAGSISKMIRLHEMDTRLLRILKEAFLEQTPEVFAPHAVQYNKYIKYLSSSVDSSVNDEIKEFKNVEYRAVNLIDLLLYSYKESNDLYEDFIIIDDKNLESMASYDTKGVYRYTNTFATMKTLDLAVALNSLYNNTNTITTLLNGQEQNASPQDIYAGPPVEKYHETLAYRIEKIGISSAGESEEVLQNFWFFNTDTTDDFQFFDSQIRYDKDYTYKVYSYNMVIGLKYAYSNLQLSRVIGQAFEDDPGPIEERVPSGYCIEYYNPYTDEAVNDMLSADADPPPYGSAVPAISALASAAQRVAFDLQSEDSKPYRAQFLVTLQPSIKIIEMPLYEKKLRVLDHPPNNVNITPSFVEDDTNRLSFHSSYQTFIEREYPNVISSTDLTVKEHYLNANDLLDSTEIILPTVSRHTNIEVYRIEEKPSAYEDFDDYYIKTIDLTLEDKYNASYNDIYFYDIVSSNKKYYYLFRIENELGMTGYFEEVLEAELINDGGYKYAIFDTLFEEDFGEDSFVQLTQPAKKLFQLTPTAQQRTLNIKDVNFEEAAHEQFDNITIGEAEDLIWGQTFKIRLTSKKTNKKIDLNITYHQTDDI